MTTDIGLRLFWDPREKNEENVWLAQTDEAGD
jgi:hypothetical protein